MAIQYNTVRSDDIMQNIPTKTPPLYQNNSRVVPDSDSDSNSNSGNSTPLHYSSSPSSLSPNPSPRPDQLPITFFPAAPPAEAKPAQTAEAKAAGAAKAEGAYAGVIKVEELGKRALAKKNIPAEAKPAQTAEAKAAGAGAKAAAYAKVEATLAVKEASSTTNLDKSKNRTKGSYVLAHFLNIACDNNFKGNLMIVNGSDNEKNHTIYKNVIDTFKETKQNISFKITLKDELDKSVLNRKTTVITETLSTSKTAHVIIIEDNALNRMLQNGILKQNKKTTIAGTLSLEIDRGTKILSLHNNKEAVVTVIIDYNLDNKEYIAVAGE
jgi:hypothetical protein